MCSSGFLMEEHRPHWKLLIWLAPLMLGWDMSKRRRLSHPVSDTGETPVHVCCNSMPLVLAPHFYK